MAPPDSADLRAQVNSISENLQGRLVEWRRHLHQYPELRFRETGTGEFIRSLLLRIGLTPTSVAGTGVSALVEGSGEGPTVALRADMDALPLSDEKTVAFRSSVPGVCHACGHDAHMAITVGVACALVALKDRFRGRVKLLFQPAEEIPSGEPSGAMAMIQAGVLENPTVDAILGFHCWPDLPAGVIGLQRGCTMASADSFAVLILGRSAHAGTPQHGRDSIAAAAHVIQALHLVSSREVAPADAHAFNIGTIRGGLSQSIVCDHVEMTGTLRTSSQPIRERLMRRLREVVEAASASFECQGSLTFSDSFPPVVNDDRLLDLASIALDQGLGQDKWARLTEVPMTAEDFSFYLDRVPGLYIKLGVAGSEGDTPAWPLHSPRFDIDESALGTGVRGLALILLRLLEAGRQGLEREA